MLPELMGKKKRIPQFMKKRIRKVLFVFSQYGGFTMEEDLSSLHDESLDYYEYIHPLTINHAHSAGEALKILKNKKYDLVILPYELADITGFELGEKIKTLYPKMPVAMLTSEDRCKGALSFLREHKKVDRVFTWYGDPKIFFAIIKVFEDILNAPEDVEKNEARAIMVVEDEPFFYSNFLPMLFRALISRRVTLLKQNLTKSQAKQQKYTRPKIFLAVNYEEAVVLFHRYRHSIIGCICDCQFPIGTELTHNAGLLLAKFVHENNWRIPILLQSQDISVKESAKKQNLFFLNKNSDLYLKKLLGFLEDFFGLGDFIFRMPNGMEIDRAQSVAELIEKIKTVDFESLAYHVQRNHFSTWFYMHGEYDLASKIFPIKLQAQEEMRHNLIAYVEKFSRS